MLSQTEQRSLLHQLLQSPPALPFEPALLPTLFAITRDGSTAGLGDLTELIERSQKLAARILSAANSPIYGQEYKVSSLQRAISLLGVREVRVLAVMEGMAAVIKGSKLPPGLDVNALWLHQLRTAAAAKALAAVLGETQSRTAGTAPEADSLLITPDEAYAAGLLHDVGKVLFASGRPDLWRTVEEQREKSGQRFHEAEHSCLGLDHALVGAEVLHRWQLPQLLTEPVNWHHAPEGAVSHKLEARLLAAANLIAGNSPEAGEELCGEALALLPDNVDAARLGEAVAQSIADAENFVTFMD